MKLFVLFMLAAFMHVSAASNAQTVTWKANNISFSEVLKVIRQQTGYEVYISLEYLKSTHPVTVDAKKMPLTDFLDAVLRHQPLEAKIEDKTIILSRKPESDPTLISKIKTNRLLQQLITIRVLDTVGRPLAGASVINQKSKQSAVADARGMLRLAADVGDMLDITFVGFDKKSITVTDVSSVLTIRLEPSLSELDETVVIAYGTTTKRFNTGNVTTITSAEIEKQPLMNPLLALQGRVPGLFMQRSGTASSAPVRVEIRGKNSINPNALTEPLYVIDGIPQTTLTLESSYQMAGNSQLGISSGVVQAGLSYTGGQSLLFSLNSNDIESISVLKDGDATAIYGSRAANGVILITTKKGNPGRTNIDLNLEQGLVMVSRYPKMLNLQQYLGMRRETLRNDGLTPSIINAPDLTIWDTTRYTDWFSQLAGTGHHTNISASVTGGDARTNFRLSGSYADRVDLYTYTGGNTRSTVRLNMGHTNANRRLNATVQASYGYTQVDAISEDFSNYMQPPNAPSIFDAAGNLNFAEWDHGVSQNPFPFGYLLQPNISRTHTLNGNLTLRYTLLEGLILSGNIGYASNNNTNDGFIPMTSQNPSRNPLGGAVFGTTKTNNITFAPQVRYNTAWGKGQLQVLLGGDLQSTSSQGVTLEGSGYTHDDLLKSINNAPSKTISEAYSEYRYAAFFGRVNFNWDWKYVLNINARRDGSSRFAPGRQFGNFGSIGLAWIVSEEDWLRASLPSWLSFVKLRGSYAITGSDGIGDYEYLSRYAIQGSGASKPMYAYNGIQPYAPVLPFNQVYQWESLKSLEAALALGFMDDRINMEVSWYQKRSGDQLVRIPTPIYTGFTNVRANWAATVQNRGLEAVFSGQVIRRRDWLWNLTFQISRNINKLYAYPGIEESPYAAQYKVGRSLSTQYFMNLLGVDPLTGAYAYEDYNRDGKVTHNGNVFPGTGDDDRYMAVNMDPRFQGGLGTDLRWKNYGISLHFSFVNQSAYNPLYSLGNAGNRMKNIVYSKSVLDDHWQKPGDRVRFAAFGSRGRATHTSVPVDGSYLRLNNVTFHYELPEKIAQKVGMQRARFSLRVQNVFTLTPYRLEPEMQGYLGSYAPIDRTAVAALSFTF